MGFFAHPSKRDTEIALEALESVGMLHLKDKPYTQISGGERQLVLIARTLAQQPDVVVMDEPTSHLDFKNQTLVLRMISKMSASGFSVIMSTHLPNHALLLSGKVALMRDGGFYRVGTPSEVITEKNLKVTYDVDVKIYSLSDEDNNRTVKYCLPVIESEATEEMKSEFKGDNDGTEQ
jgi:ABC-type cobalamin/Fe3+-siderophores transport system ATPase subunit